MKNLNKEFGKHYLIELIGCEQKKIKFVKDVRKSFISSAKKSRTTILKDFFHQFKPFGVSGIIFIAESHFSIHTWPEENYAGVDIFTCGEMDPKAAIDELKKCFNPKKLKYKIYPRGF